MTQNTSQNQFRPPIVAFMGHIDHGKTSLLDKIRSTNTWRQEVGGITQHISSYQAVVPQKSGPDKLITFVDTPGHAAFCNMRSRGSQITDIVVLVIAASEGIMAQTKECIELIKKSDTPVIVALNKIDLPNANPQMAKGQLVEAGLTPEEYGGQIPVVPVSAKTGEGIKELLDSILLHADVMELKAKPNAPLSAAIIESKLDKRRGPVALAIVSQGTLKLGDTVYVGDTSVRVKALNDTSNQPLKAALPSTPVEILGFPSPPPVGSIITSTSQEVAAPTKPSLPQSPQPESDEEAVSLPVVIKADVEGTLEALLASFSSEVNVIQSGVGPVTDNDIFLAQEAGATIYAFDVPVPKQISRLAENEGVSIFSSRIIYEIIEDIQSKVLKLMEPTIDEDILGEGTIKAEFNINKVRIAGVVCTKGELSKGDTIHLKRDNKIIKDTKIEGIRRGKEEVDKVKVGNDCGMTFRPYVDFRENDVIISYKKSK